MYGSVPNLLDFETQLLGSGIGRWVADENSSVGRSSILDGDIFAENTLAVEVLDGSSASAFVEEITIPQIYRRWPARFHVYIGTNSSASLNVELEIEGDAAGTWTAFPESGKLFQGGTWHMIDVASEVNDSNDFPNLSSVAKVTVGAFWDPSETGPKRLYVKIPTVSIPLAVRFNNFAAETWLRLPEYMQDGDRQPDSPDFPLLRFIDVVTAVSDAVFKKWEEFRYLSPESNGQILKSSSLSDPEKASVEVLLWLAQFLGFEFLDPRIGATSWKSLLSTADPVDETPTWDEFVTNIDAAEEPTNGTLEWTEIQDLADDISPETLRAFFSWQISSAAYGLRGGTTASLKAAARQGLINPNGYVNIVKNADGDPFKIRVEVEQSDLSDTETTIEELLAPTTPAGYEIEVSAVTL
jgi:hypothetical protein